MPTSGTHLETVHDGTVQLSGYRTAWLSWSGEQLVNQLVTACKNITKSERVTLFVNLFVFFSRNCFRQNITNSSVPFHIHCIKQKVASQSAKKISSHAAKKGFETTREF